MKTKFQIYFQNLIIFEKLSYGMIQTPENRRRLNTELVVPSFRMHATRVLLIDHYVWSSHIRACPL